MKLLIVAFCLLSFSKAQEAIDKSYQCNDLYIHDASKKGEVTSPFFYERERYHDGLWCEYKIQAPKGNRIKLTFKVMDIDPSSGCYQDKLIIYSQDKQRTLGYFCGTEPPHPLMSLEGENELNILFQTDFMGARKGFKIEYESSPNLLFCNPGFTACRNRNCYDRRKKCDGNDDCGDGTDEEGCGLPLVVEPEECGVPAITPDTKFGKVDRLVGGDTAVPNSWPWMVSLQYFGSEPNGHFCGGTLINAQWVLTATHCVVAYESPEGLKIQIGSHHKFKKSPYEQTRSAIKIIAYPDLEFDKMSHFDIRDDISLIKLNAPVKFNDGVMPACMPQLGWKPQAGWSCYATGWGATRGSGGSDELKQMEQYIESTQNCSFNEEKQVCVGKPLNSPCHGDSGGPLQCRLGGRWYVFGAASYVTTTNMMSGLCVGSNAKTVYASAADKAQWIRTIINKYS